MVARCDHVSLEAKVNSAHANDTVRVHFFRKWDRSNVIVGFRQRKLWNEESRTPSVLEKEYRRLKDHPKCKVQCKCLVWLSVGKVVLTSVKICTTNNYV
jgi:hypothetical protein